MGSGNRAETGGPASKNINSTTTDYGYLKKGSAAKQLKRRDSRHKCKTLSVQWKERKGTLERLQEFKGHQSGRSED